MVNRPLIYAIVYTVLTFTFVDAAEHEIFQFGKICSLRPQQITEDLPFYVYYDSMFETGPIWCSYIGFSARGANSRDKYQICTTLHTFRDPMCSVKVSLRNSLNGTALRTFSCTETSKSKFCVTQGEDLYIVLDFMSSVEEKPAEFIFYVDATKTYNHIATVAGVSVGVAAICIVIFVLIVVKCRNRKSHSPLLRNRFRNTSGK
ncbi:uncharacterized protein LOC133176904 [Saccostrea echinata]|uniref:uncharacterized protein LOC133176904 n=1 Tax=Saccostrea echinata TaxID=191078 RepID=UPI002A820A37|nr:uncharacterized protein LOC133176904 [Saccostrea echinata]